MRKRLRKKIRKRDDPLHQPWQKRDIFKFPVPKNYFHMGYSAIEARMVEALNQLIIYNGG